VAVGVEHLHADDAPLSVVVEHDAVGDLLALDDRRVGKAQIGRVGGLVVGQVQGHRALRGRWVFSDKLIGSVGRSCKTFIRVIYYASNLVCFGGIRSCEIELLESPVLSEVRMRRIHVFWVWAFLCTQAVSASAMEIYIGVNEEDQESKFLSNMFANKDLKEAGLELNIRAYESEERIIRDVLDGRVQLGLVSAYVFQQTSSKEPLIASVMATYVQYGTAADIFSTQESPLGEAALAEAGIPGIVPLAFWNRRQAGIISKNQLKDLSDFKGAKVATQPIGWGQKIFEQAGASAVLIPQSDAYSAFEAGAVDAVQVNKEVQLIENGEKFSGATLLTGFDTGIGFLLANEKFIYEIDEFQRHSIRKAVAEAKEENQRTYVESEVILDKFAKELGISVINANESSDQDTIGILEGIFGQYSNGIKLSTDYYYWIRDINKNYDELEQKKGGSIDPVKIISNNVLFATDRNEYDGRDFIYRYGPLREREWEYKCGDVEFEKQNNRKLGDSYYGYMINSNEVISDKVEECAKYIVKKLEDTSTKELLIYIHGFNNDFESAVRRTIGFSMDLGAEDRIYLV
jgi:TRAP-type C4-dicarboxylate transport system substrate-binding protein